MVDVTFTQNMITRARAVKFKKAISYFRAVGFREAVGMGREKVWVRSLVLYYTMLGSLNYLPA